MFLPSCLIVTSMIVVTSAVSPFLTDGDSCGEWSVWEPRPWGSARRRESCVDGRVEEQCRSEFGMVIRCRMTSDTASAPHLDARRPGLKSYSYYYYYYYYSGSASPYTVTFSPFPYYSFYYNSDSALPCSIGCMIGIGFGSFVGVAFLVVGTVVAICFCCKSGRHVVRPGVVTASHGNAAIMTRGTPVMTVPAYNGGVALYPAANIGTYNNQGFNQEQQFINNQPTTYSNRAAYPPPYPGAYPSTYPTTYPTTYPNTYPTTYPTTYPETQAPETAFPPTSNPSSSQPTSVEVPPPYSK